MNLDNLHGAGAVAESEQMQKVWSLGQNGVKAANNSRVGFPDVRTAGFRVKESLHPLKFTEANNIY